MRKRLAKIMVLCATMGIVTLSYADNDNNGYQNFYNPYFGLGGWTFKVGIPYQKFSNNGTQFASNDGHVFNIDTSYHAGYNLGIGYHFQESGTDVSLDYTHVDTTDSHAVWANDVILGGEDVGPFSWAKAKIEFGYETFDLTASHMIPLLPTFSVNYYGGLSYLHLTKDMTMIGENDREIGLVNRFVIEAGTSYKGFGPTFGLGGSCYPLPPAPQFSVIGDVRASFYYGTLDSYDREFDHTGEIPQTFITHLPSEKIVVPGVAAKLGLNYAFPTQGMKINAQLGYAFHDYFNVTKDSSYGATNADISFQGPYFTLGITF